MDDHSSRMGAALYEWLLEGYDVDGGLAGDIPAQALGRPGLER